MAHIKEVQDVIDEGISEPRAELLYQVITEKFEEICGQIETDDFQRSILDIRKNERPYFREVIDDVCNRYTFSAGLNWRNLKYEPIRIQRCQICGDYFYDISRNGKKLTCSKGGVYQTFDVTNRKYRYFHKNGKRLSVCGALYEQRRRAGSVLYPESKRNPNEVLTDFNPDENDKKGHAWLNEVELTAWKSRW